MGNGVYRIVFPCAHPGMGCRCWPCYTLPPPMRYSMHVFWESIVRPLLQAAQSRHIVEIGAGGGEHTYDLLRYCAENRAVLTVIDPSPDFPWEEWQGRYGEAFRFHKKPSLDALPDIHG